MKTNQGLTDGGRAILNYRFDLSKYGGTEAACVAFPIARMVASASATVHNLQWLRQLHCIAWVKCKCSIKQNCRSAGKEDSPDCVATKQEVTPAQPQGEI